MFSNLSALLRISAKPKNHYQLYMMSKAIDGLDAEGSFILATGRVNKYFWPSNGLFYYTQLKSIEELGYATTLNSCLEYEKVDQGYSLGLQLDFECFQSIYDTPGDGIVPIPTFARTDRSLGRHAVEIIGFDESVGLIEFRNSWGTTWGNNGFGFLPIKYLKLYGKEMLLSTNARYGLTADKFEKHPEIQSSITSMAKVWLQENRRDQESILWNGKRLNIVWYSILNMSGQIVEIFDLRNHEGKRLGWTHLKHVPELISSVKISVIEELFIWPVYRKKGYGTLLEQYCYDSALRYGSKKIKIPFTEMDDLKGDRSPVRIFTAKLGYNHSFNLSVLPCTTGFAEKLIGLL